MTDWLLLQNLGLCPSLAHLKIVPDKESQTLFMILFYVDGDTI
jgi:hypothetical protein